MSKIKIEKDENGYLVGYVDGKRKYSTDPDDETVEEMREFAEFLNACADLMESEG